MISIDEIGSFDMANTIEWYILPKASSAAVTDPLWMTIGHYKPQFPSIRFKNPQVFIEYAHGEMTYMYDRSNDSQRVLSRTLLYEGMGAKDSVYQMVINEETLPSHRFPCTMDSISLSFMVRRSVKINNRIFFIEEECKEDKDSMESTFVYYIKYNHSFNVDTKKMSDDLNAFIGRYNITLL